MVVYKTSEYTAARYLILARGTIIENADKVAVIVIISAHKLIIGGAAIFAAHMINHSILITGSVIWMPLFKNKLRELLISYVKLALANIDELTKPWAIIIPRAPHMPHILFVITPASTRLICPTDE